MATQTTVPARRPQLPPSRWRRALGLEPLLPPEPTAEELARPSVTAASRVVSGRRLDRGQARPERWQDEAIELYSQVGELRFVAHAQAAAGSRATLFPARFTEPDAEPEAVTDGIVSDVWEQFGGGRLGRAELVKRLLIQLFIPGDGMIVGLPPGVLDDGQVPNVVALEDLSWHALSAQEAKLRSGKLTLELGDTTRKVDESKTVVVRAWRPNPFRWWQADSPVRSNLAVLRELVGLTKHVSASIDSRLAGAGVLLIGDSFSLLAGQSPDEDDDSDVDPILAALMDAMVTAIKDRDSASAVMPIVLQGPDDAVDKVKHLTFNTPFDAQAKDLRDEAIRRLALGLDAPPEVLLGLGSSTHWNAWIIQDDYVKTQIDPSLSLICDALTQDYLRPLLEHLRVPDAHEYAIWWDTTALTQRPDRSNEAIQVAQMGELSGEALRRETGFDENDAPQQPDRAVEIALKMVQDQPGPVLENPQLINQVIEILRAALSEGQDVSAAEDAVEDELNPEPETPADLPVNGPPDTINDVEELPASARPRTLPLDEEGAGDDRDDG